MFSSASDKAKLFAENFCKNSNVDDSSISLLVFPSRPNLKLYNISLLSWIGALTLSVLLKLPPRTSMKFLCPEVPLFLYKSTIRPCMEYYCHVWAGAPAT